jgi:Flp pilus assembly protein TadG
MWALRHIRKTLNKLRACCDRDDGVAAVEFALVAFPFLFLLFVILETGWFFVLAILIEGAAAEGARQVRTGVVQSAPTPATDLQTRVCDNVFFLIGCGDLIIDVNSSVDFTNIVLPSLPATQGGATFTPGGPGSIVVVRVIYNWSFLTPFLQDVINIKQMVSTVAFRNEPY